jgi:hypothetical protein
VHNGLRNLPVWSYTAPQIFAMNSAWPFCEDWYLQRCSFCFDGQLRSPPLVAWPLRYEYLVHGHCCRTPAGPILGTRTAIVNAILKEYVASLECILTAPDTATNREERRRCKRSGKPGRSAYSLHGREPYLQYPQAQSGQRRKLLPGGCWQLVATAHYVFSKRDTHER